MSRKCWQGTPQTRGAHQFCDGRGVQPGRQADRHRFPGNTARVWDTESGKELRKLEGHTEGALCVAFSPDGKRIVTTSVDDTARVWDAD